MLSVTHEPIPAGDQFSLHPNDIRYLYQQVSLSNKFCLAC